MFNTMKVTITNSFGQSAEVDGVIAKDGVHVVATAIRKIKPKWKPNKGGGATALIAIGDMLISVLDKEGNLHKSVLNQSTVFCMQSKQIENGEEITLEPFIRDIRQQQIVTGREEDKPVNLEHFLSDEIKEAMDESINIAAENIIIWRPGQTNSKLARAAAALSKLATFETNRSEHIEQSQEFSGETTASDLIPENEE